MNKTERTLTEQRNLASTHLDSLSTLNMVRLFNQQDAHVPLAIAAVLPQIAQAADWFADTLRNDGRVFYQGAGTSGRLAVLDAAELLPTFGVGRDQVVALLAGGQDALTTSIEGAEDSTEQGQRDLMQHGFSRHDMLIGIAASGRTPYTLAGLTYAHEVGAQTVALVCNSNTPMSDVADLAIEALTGPEILTGSTRLKAGTAQKLVLNTISTCAMVKLGKVYGNLMVDVQPTNAKLQQRSIRIVMESTGISADTAEQLLNEADWGVKTAVVMALADVDAIEAKLRLANHQGFVRQAIYEQAIKDNQ
ncbi:MAG: N-acetylmuramic acid 6-phosphate etherase [Chloroflexota bacterium]